MFEIQVGAGMLYKAILYQKKDESVDENNADPFLKALAKGGFQVGELVKYYFQKIRYQRI